jgi:peptide/nickel transport system permease protein
MLDLAGIGQEDSAMLMRYAAMRLVQLIPMVLVVTMVVFFVMMIVPGDPVMVMLGAVDGAQVSREVYDAMRVRLGPGAEE